MADLVEQDEWIEFAGLPVEDQLLDHLATSEGATAIWKDRLDPVCVKDDGVRDALSFVLKFMDEHREPPALALFSEETGFDEFQLPKTPVKYVITKLRDQYRRAELRKVVTKIGRLSSDPEEAVSYGLRELSDIQLLTSSRGENLSSLDMLSTVDRYNESLKNPQMGISLGYPAMDRAIGGLRLGELTVILGRPKRYKSWQVLKSADAAWEQGHTGAIQTMELSSADMLDRWVCMRTGISWKKFKDKMLSAQDLADIEDMYDFVLEQKQQLHFLRPKPGERNVAHLVNTAQEVGADVMYIDQLSWFDDAKSDDSWRKIGKIMEQLKDAASLFPIYMACQFSREAANLTEIADLSKIGLSDMIGQTSDTILGLYASSEMMDQKILHMGVVESRSFEKIGWELKVHLSEDSDFHVLNKLDPTYS